MLRLLCCLLIAVTCHAAPPNIVWIIADDMSPDTGAYGLAQVKTPHLDRLAAEGRRYTRAYSTAPVCSSSRSAFILGCYQTTTGLHPHDTE
ncbi:MAG: sulfatase-like hydrolase/transferase, partial [Verrucomicrobiaceae bacterium]|nr:sulfatase-like hydrolase/transferase [Verrucomicrobiaceae bacterium]